MNIKKLAHEQARYRLGNLWDQKNNADTERCEVVTIKSLPGRKEKGFQKWRKWQPDLEHMFEIDKTLKIPCVRNDNWASTAAMTDGEKNVYQFCKQRSVGDLNTGMFNHNWLYDIESRYNISQLETCKIPFECKKPILFWRGQNTGNVNDFQRGRLSEKGYTKNQVRNIGKRDMTVSYYHTNPDPRINITMSNGKKNATWNQKDRVAITEYIRRALREYKYMLYLEGNDIGSNVWWTYKTNCVVFRPDVTRCACVYDLYLKPWKHYVPYDALHPEDLLDKIDWCEKNTDKCLKMIQCANSVHALILDKDLRHETYKIMAKKIKDNLIV